MNTPNKIIILKFFTDISFKHMDRDIYLLIVSFLEDVSTS